MKFIYTCVSVNIKYETCKCKNKYIYIILHGPIYRPGLTNQLPAFKLYIYIWFYMAM
jgi:hypothetical protein